jgi:DNA polymerase-4
MKKKRRYQKPPTLFAEITFIPAQRVPFSLFEDNLRKNTLRKTVYEVKAKFGSDKLMRAAEFLDNPGRRDISGLGPIKELHDDQNPF